MTPPRALALTPLALTGCFSGGVHMGPHFYIGVPGWLLCGVIGAWIATSKGRGGCTWFALCAVLGPLAVVIAALVDKVPERRD